MAHADSLTIDHQAIGDDLANGLKAYGPIPETRLNNLARDIATCIESRSYPDDRTETVELVIEIDEELIQPMLSILQFPETDQLPMTGTKAHDSYWMYTAERLDAEFGTSLADDPLYEAPDGWRREDLELVSVDLPPPTKPVHHWIIEREQAVTPCPRCSHLKLSYECLGWWQEGVIPMDRGWIVTYHTCPECPTTAVGLQWVPSIWDLSDIVLDAIDVWLADWVPGMLARKVQIIVEVGGVGESILGGYWFME